MRDYRTVIARNYGFWVGDYDNTLLAGASDASDSI